MFTTPCFVRSVSEKLREELNALGYTDLYTNTVGTQEVKTITATTENGGWFLTGFVPDNKEIKYIDCGNNEDLFIALAALRDDNDYMQWFVSQVEKDSPKVFIKSTTHSCTQSLSYIHRWDWRCTKATVKELIEHFNNG